MEDWNYYRSLLRAKKNEAKSRKQMEYYLEEIQLIGEIIRNQESSIKE